MMPCPPPGYLPDSGIEPVSLTSPSLLGVFFHHQYHLGRPHYTIVIKYIILYIYIITCQNIILLKVLLKCFSILNVFTPKELFCKVKENIVNVQWYKQKNQFVNLCFSRYILSILRLGIVIYPILIIQVLKKCLLNANYSLHSYYRNITLKQCCGLVAWRQVAVQSLSHV